MRPAKLYKYQPFTDYALGNLAENRIYFSQPPDFNDPFEFHVRFETGALTPQRRTDLISLGQQITAKKGVSFEDSDRNVEALIEGLVSTSEAGMCQ